MVKFKDFSDNTFIGVEVTAFEKIRVDMSGESGDGIIDLDVKTAVIFSRELRKAIAEIKNNQ